MNIRLTAATQLEIVDQASRLLRLRLCALDVPAPFTPSGGKPGKKYILDSAAVEQCGATLIGEALRANRKLDSHTETGPDGVSRLAMAIGSFTAQRIETDGDTRYWDTYAKWWPQQDAEIAALVAEKQGKGELGGSFELDAQVEDRGDEVHIVAFQATGAATLLKSKAAFGDFTDVLFASFEAVPEDRREGLVREFTRLAAAASAPTPALPANGEGATDEAAASVAAGKDTAMDPELKAMLEKIAASVADPRIEALVAMGDGMMGPMKQLMDLCDSEDPATALVASAGLVAAVAQNMKHRKSEMPPASQMPMYYEQMVAEDADALKAATDRVAELEAKVAEYDTALAAAGHESLATLIAENGERAERERIAAEAKLAERTERVKAAFPTMPEAWLKAQAETDDETFEALVAATVVANPAPAADPLKPAPLVVLPLSAGRDNEDETKGPKPVEGETAAERRARREAVIANGSGGE